MENSSKTIAALATAPGIGGIAVIRISGREAFALCTKIFFQHNAPAEVEKFKTHTVHFGEIRDPEKTDNPLIDSVVLTVFKSPQSYTGEDVAEISCHGGNVISGMILDLLYRTGAFPAEPGEYTKRAFLNGKLNLMQAEAVADLIDSVSVPTARAAARLSEGALPKKLSLIRSDLIKHAALLETELDFLDDNLPIADHKETAESMEKSADYCRFVSSQCHESEVLRSGYRVAVAGFPNSGKSTLFNALLDRNRAIVSSTPGTTRDYIEEMLYINQIPIRLIDTAGLRAEASDTIEAEGIRLVEKVLSSADLILILNDITLGVNHSKSLRSTLAKKYPDTEILTIQNKTDKTTDINYKSGDIFISAKFGKGLDDLRQKIYSAYKNNLHPQDEIFINKRHASALESCAEELEAGAAVLRQSDSGELAAINIRLAAQYLGIITGETYSNEVLNEIFSHFCIGK